MLLHRGEGQIRRPQPGQLSRSIARRRSEPPRDQQPQPEQPAEEKAVHQKEILGQHPRQRGGKQPGPYGPWRPFPLLQRLPQHNMAIQQHNALQHHQAVHTGKDGYTLHADAQQPAGRRCPRRPEPPGQTAYRQIQHRCPRKQADKVRQQPDPRQPQPRKERFRRVDQTVIERRVDIDLLVVPWDAVGKGLLRRQHRLVKAAVMPAVQITVLQRIKAAGVVGQLIGIQLVHMVALLAPGIEQHHRKPHRQQRRYCPEMFCFRVCHDSRFLILRRTGAAWSFRYQKGLPQRAGLPFVVTPRRFLPYRAQSATAHRW